MPTIVLRYLHAYHSVCIVGVTHYTSALLYSYFMAIFSTLPEHWQNEFGKFLFQGELNTVKCKTFKCLVMGSAAAGCCLLSVIKSSSPVPRLCPFIFTGCGLWMDLPDPFFWSRAGLHLPSSLPFCSSQPWRAQLVQPQLQVWLLELWQLARWHIQLLQKKAEQNQPNMKKQG